MGRAAVRVIVRTRPTDALARESYKFLDDARTVVVRSARVHQDLPNPASAPSNDHAFKVDLVLKDTSQEHVFDMAASDIVRSLMSGYNGTVLCYGQTGSGKTYTMMGGGDYATRGIVPRAVKAVFDDVTAQPDRIYHVAVSYMEVYNERIRDLLDPTSVEDFAVLEDGKGGITVRGVQQRDCAREEDCLAALFEGGLNRTVADHVLNPNSSRSHTIYTVHVTSRSRVESDSVSVTSKLHFVDLAGSERLSKTASDGATAKEAQYINKSLTFLEQVVMALGTAGRTHVPFRQSRLTSLLKDSLGGNCKTTMIANVWPEDRHAEESIGTLRFAARMMKVQTDATVNLIVDPQTQIKQLQRTIHELKAELQMQNQLMAKSHISYEGDITDDERYEMEKVVKGYLGGTQGEIPVRSLREVREFFRIFKAFSEQRAVEAATIAQPAASAPPAPGAKGTAAIPSVPLSASGQDRTRAVGVVDKAAGVSVGVAAPCKSLKDVVRSPTKGGHASPHRSNSPAPDPLDSSQNELNATIPSASPTRGNTAGADTNADPADRHAAFDDFKRTAGARLVETIRESQQSLGEAQQRIKELIRTVNDTKAVIDGYQIKLDQRRQDRVLRGEEETVDREEFAIVRHVKEARGHYTAHFDELQTRKADRDQLQRAIAMTRQQLLADFGQWYTMVHEAAGPGSGQRISAAPTAQTRAALGIEPDENLDEGEWFDLLQMSRVKERDPDALAYYSAKRVVRSKAARTGPPGHTGAGRRTHSNTRR